MLKNYLKIAWRNLIKNKVYSLINLSGLTIGMICFILIALFIQYELSYDTYHEKSNRIYRIVQQQKGNNYSGTDMFALAPLPLGDAMLKDFPEVEEVTNLNLGNLILSKDEDIFLELGLLTDPSIFNVFTIPVLQGKGKEALEQPETIVLTESLAKKIFGTSQALGKLLQLNNNTTLTVRGIVADPPKNQHFSYSYILSNKLSRFYDLDVGNWVSNNYHSYISLKPSANYKDLERQMSKYEKFTKSAYQNEGLTFYPKFKLQPLKDIHLYSNMNSELGPNGNMRSLLLFLGIAFIILILASVNYMNLATVKSAQRAKEVGISKVLGAQKRQLIAQFLGESFLLTFVSFFIALVLVRLLLPAFNTLLNKTIPFEIGNNWWTLAAMVFIALLVGSFSGLYPAFFLSSANPVKALKGNFLKGHKEGISLRNGLVIGQFVIAIGLVIGSVVIYQQLQFIKNKELGYTKQRVVHVPYNGGEISEKENIIRAELLKHPKIDKVSISTQLPLSVTSNGPVDTWEGNHTKEQLYLYRTYVDYHFIDLFEMNLIEGRNFNKEIASDSTAYILNQSAVKALGWSDAIGKTFNDGVVIGVLEDFHLQTFDLPIEPLFMILRDEDFSKNYGQVILKVTMDNFEETRTFIEKTLKSVVPSAPYDIQFMEDSYAFLYDKETRLGSAFTIFSFLALFIAGMGLFGIVSFNVLQRTKEIGIRKVLGCSVTGIVKLVSQDFLKLILIALTIATPISYYFINIWLQNFAYKVKIEWSLFVIVGAASIAIAFITISFQSIKAAMANPIKSLRTE